MDDILMDLFRLQDISVVRRTEEEVCVVGEITRCVLSLWLDVVFGMADPW